MPDTVFAVVVAVVVEEPTPLPHMFQRCLQPTNKDMEAAGVDTDAAEADARNNNIPLAVSSRPRAWEVCFPQPTRCPHPQVVEAIRTTLPLKEACQDMPLKVACSCRSGPLLQCRQTLRELECMLHVRL
jgi:hypothetical protein